MIAFASLMTGSEHGRDGRGKDAAGGGRPVLPMAKLTRSDRGSATTTTAASSPSPSKSSAPPTVTPAMSAWRDVAVDDDPSLDDLVAGGLDTEPAVAEEPTFTHVWEFHRGLLPHSHDESLSTSTTSTRSSASSAHTGSDENLAMPSLTELDLLDAPPCTDHVCTIATFTVGKKKRAT